MARDESACACGSRATSVHHLTYERVACERLTDLRAVCETCHAELHRLMREDGLSLAVASARVLSAGVDTAPRVPERDRARQRATAEHEARLAERRAAKDARTAQRQNFTPARPSPGSGMPMNTVREDGTVEQVTRTDYRGDQRRPKHTVSSSPAGARGSRRGSTSSDA